MTSCKTIEFVGFGHTKTTSGGNTYDGGLEVTKGSW